MMSHECAGGLGENDIWDIIQAHKLVLLAQCLNQKGEMGIIMQGAIEHLQEEAKITSNPLQTKITHYMEPKTQTWLYPLKKWMEENDIMLSENPEPQEEKIGEGIMDACRRKREAKQIWKWATKQKHINRYEIADKKGVIKREILDTIPDNVKTSVITQMKETAKATQMSNYNIMVGEEVEHRSGIRGKVCRKKNKYLEIKTKIGKIWYKRANCIPIEKCDQKENSIKKSTKIEGLKKLIYWEEPMAKVKLRNNKNETLMAVSDGSVRNGTQGGT